jgi:hypothetical protein
MDWAYLVAYITPTIIAALRKQHNTGSVAAMNLLLGWTVIFWWVALFMAFAKQKTK